MKNIVIFHISLTNLVKKKLFPTKRLEPAVIACFISNCRSKLRRKWSDPLLVAETMYVIQIKGIIKGNP